MTTGATSEFLLRLSCSHQLVSLNAFRKLPQPALIGVAWGRCVFLTYTFVASDKDTCSIRVTGGCLRGQLTLQ